MNELQIFNNPEFGEIRAVEKDGEPWFVGKDVCQLFGDTNHNRTLARVDEADKTMVGVTDSLGRNQLAIAINESGLYAVLFSMQPQKANNDGVQDAYPIEVQERIDKLRKFKRWVTRDVIPSIRKHGAYMTPQTIEQVLTDPDTIIRLATMLKEEQQRRKELEAKNLALETENKLQKQAIADFEPIKRYVDEILSSERTLTTTQIAADYDMSAKKLNKILHEEGVQHKVNKQWILYKKHMGHGYTKSKTVQITRSNGKPDTVLHTEWTQKGRLLIHELLNSRGIQAVMDRQDIT